VQKEHQSSCNGLCIRSNVFDYWLTESGDRLCSQRGIRLPPKQQPREKTTIWRNRRREERDKKQGETLMEVCFKGMQMRQGNLQSCRTQRRNIKHGSCGCQRGKGKRKGLERDPHSLYSIDTTVPLFAASASALSCSSRQTPTHMPPHLWSLHFNLYMFLKQLSANKAASKSPIFPSDSCTC